MSSPTESAPGSPEDSASRENTNAPGGSDPPADVGPTQADGAATTQEFDPPGSPTAVQDPFGEWFSEPLHSDDFETRPSLDGRPDTAPQRPTLRLAGFEVLGLIGRGGMGVVFKARQLSLNRVVALKILPPALAADQRRVQRFRNEAAVASRLTHSRILPLYDVIDAGGAPVLVMPFVDGCDLERILMDRRAVLKGKSAEGRHPSSTLGARSFLDHILPLLDQAVEAVAVLHEAGIIHRDIKPSNLLVDRLGEVFLSDFGLSRLNEGVGLTLPNQGMGTPGYMSPEQWDGARDVDARADVFSIGATLYKALTLDLPYGTGRVGSEMPLPARPSLRSPGLPAEFNTVILKALEPDRALRYESGIALRDDWRRVRAGDEPLARTQSRVGRLIRRASKRPALTGALTMILLLGGLLGWLQWRLNAVAARDPTQPRSVRIRTNPPGARVAVARLDPFTGDPLLDHPIVPAWGQRTPTDLPLSPGDYFVEVAWDNGHFEQVFRHVPPRSETIPMAYRQLYWKDVGGTLEISAIHDRELTGDAFHDNMTRFEGSPAFTVPKDPATGTTFAARQIPPFYLDNTEVALGEFRKPGRTLKAPMVRIPPQLRQPGVDALEAVRFIDFDCALQYAELRGKRLPTEAEFRYAFTNGGQTDSPSGARQPDSHKTWRIGTVGLDPDDRLLSHPDVVGLDSNVAEWTTSRNTAWIPSITAAFARSRSVDLSTMPNGVVPMRTFVAVGAPPSVVLNRPTADEVQARPYPLYRLSSTTTREGLGFRCARSAEPYFLKPDATAAVNR